MPRCKVCNRMLKYGKCQWCINKKEEVKQTKLSFEGVNIEN